MKYRFLGNSGLQVSELGFGAGTLGGKGQIFSAWGQPDQNEANRLIKICLDAGINYFDTADVYSDGASETMLGRGLGSERKNNIISTKIGLRYASGLNETGFHRHYLKKAVEASLKRLNTDYIDVLQLHQFDSFTSLEQLMRTLNELVQSGKVRFIGVSNFSGWQLMKAQAIAEQYGYEKFVANQVYYSLIGRDYEWELMPLNDDQHIGAVIWSPLGWGRLTGRFDREYPIPASSRLHQTAQYAPPVDDEHLYRVLEVMQQINTETGYSIPQIALSWLLGRPTVSSVLVGARNEQQLRDNLLAQNCDLSTEYIEKLNQISAVSPPYPYYPYWNGQFGERFKPIVASQMG